jgi:hypothetical protein
MVCEVAFCWMLLFIRITRTSSKKQLHTPFEITLFNLSDMPVFCGFDHLLDSEAMEHGLEINY